MSGFFSNSVDEKAVEELLSQAMDAAVLEQVAAIHCAGLHDSALPSHLETRFRNLKALPPSAMKPASSSTQTQSLNLPLKNGFPTCLKESQESKNCSTEIFPRGQLGKKYPSNWNVISSRSVSPPVRSTGCFLCCPKQLSRKKSNNVNDDRGLVLELRDDLISSDLSSFSVKKQEKIMKKAEKIVKYASAMMDVSGR
ncbi:hypothetical protein Sango_2246100 [Sesamum angolense]|uniref:Uncharacterized protein n=1 Tax=Sesamum angolense TaxID=2727404 RepID=A0AAE2BKU8_9LAMI|nr:hypothetical protein Sango_2246100 [Sesamum angolense]